MSATQVLSENVISEIDHWVEKFPKEQKKSAVIAALTAAQEDNNGGLSTDVMDAVADYLDMPKSAVYEVASFYTLLHTEPVGRNKVSICTNVSCMLCGGREIVEHLENKLGINEGETSDDGRVTLIKEEECLAACCGAPMMVVNGHYHEHLTIDKVNEIVDSLE